MGPWVNHWSSYLQLHNKLQYAFIPEFPLHLIYCSRLGICISVNHKTEDGVLRSLNRLAQRKLLDSLSAVRPESNTSTAISDEQLKRYGFFRITPLFMTGEYWHQELFLKEKHFIGQGLLKVRLLSHDIMADILVFQNYKMTAMLAYQTNPSVYVKPFLYVNTFSFVPINLHGCWPCEWKYSISWFSYCNSNWTERSITSI